MAVKKKHDVFPYFGFLKAKRRFSKDNETPVKQARADKKLT